MSRPFMKNDSVKHVANPVAKMISLHLYYRGIYLWHADLSDFPGRYFFSEIVPACKFIDQKPIRRSLSAK